MLTRYIWWLTSVENGDFNLGDFNLVDTNDLSELALVGKTRYKWSIAEVVDIGQGGRVLVCA